MTATVSPTELDLELEIAGKLAANDAAKQNNQQKRRVSKQIEVPNLI